MFQEIYVIDEQEELTEELKKMFKEEPNYRFKRILTKDMDYVSNNLPQLIIINDDTITKNTIELCTEIRKTEDNNIIPIIVLSSREDKEFKIDLAKNYVEYYVAKSMGLEYLYYRIRNIFRLLVLNRTISPLTGLPGNTQIQAELKKRLAREKEFIVLYLDLDDFKAYNDVYGFLKGDEIIKFTARTILENVNNIANSNAFVGHIGGDDFVAILDENTNYEEICRNIIAQFDKGVKYFFTEEDYNRGYLKIQNRKGKMEHFFLTAISIGVVQVESDKYSNVLEIGEVGAQVKHIAKKYKGSCYAIDRRKH
jgi:diguanylate cyclase (GGDEF)-like protein